MSHETKGGRTMIGTVPPINHPRPASGTHPRPMQATGPQQPTILAPGQGLPPPLAPAPPLTAAPTVGLRGAATPTGGTFAEEDPDIVVGQELCGYVIRRKLAEGGMGVVYEGVHAKIGRLGAIKVLKRELCRSEDVVERFYQEARAVNSIRHDNIVDIYDFGRDAYGRVFFVMEYLEGEPLSARIARGALAWPEAFPILEQTLRALKAAHDKGYVHRDLKPDNIWLKYVEGRVAVKLLDFGIAKLVGTESPREKLTQTGSVIGTPHYMSPEQINGSRDVDHRTDIYALGVITYEMFAGVTPFVGDTLQAVMTGHLFRDPPRLAELPTHITIAGPMAGLVDRVLVRLLAKDPSGRYDSAADVLADLHDVSRNRTPTHADTLERSRPLRPPTLVAGAPATSAPPRKRRTGLVLGGAVAAAAIAVAGVAISRSQDVAAPVAAVPPLVVETKRPPPTPPGDKTLDYEALRKDAQITLRAALRETEPVVRTQGSDALGKTKDRPAVPQLTELTEQDPDPEVRGHAAGALGAIGATAATPLLAKLEAAAPPPLKVWYASALARLGDKTATRRLFDYARSKDLAVSFKAGITLAELSQPGDKNAIAALKSIAAREAELAEVERYAGAVILTKMAGLRDAAARKVLYSILENPDEGARLAAAEGLAKLGDDAGKPVLTAVMANPDSPNRLVAAVAQIPLGDYAGAQLITAALKDPKPQTRRLAARALGEIAERTSLPPLIELAKDSDWTVRIAAAAAIVSIVGIDPAVLAQASVDWTKSALESQDWAVRKAAAGVLADIPEKQAVPLLAQAIVDPDPKVRLAASRSAGKMKGAEAAAKVVAAVKDEADPAVKEQQVAALGAIGNAVAHDTLAEIAEQPGRIGVIAAGSLISVGDLAGGKAKLDAAVIAPEVGIRLAAVQAASTTNNAVVIPTLKIGLLDKIFDIKFTAAEGLAAQNAEKAAVMPVLTAGLSSKDPEMYTRAMASLTRLGEKLGDARTPAEMLDVQDPRQRLAVVSVVRAMQPSEAVPLLRRLIADPDQEVRHAGVDAIEVVVAKDKEQAIRLYRPLVNDVDPFVRSKAAGQLSRLVPPPPPLPGNGQLTATPPPAPPPPDPRLPAIQKELDAATGAASEIKAARDAMAQQVTELAAATRTPSHDDAAIKQVEDLTTGLDESAGRLEALATKAETAAKAAADAAGTAPSADARTLVDGAAAMAKDSRAIATDARSKATDAAAKARVWLGGETVDVPQLLATAEMQIAASNYGAAKQSLDKAAAAIRKTSASNSVTDYLYGQLYDGMARRANDDGAKIKLFKQAEAAYRRFVRTGSGARLKTANARIGEIPDDIKELGVH